jgi:hypothetical protein
MNCIEMQSSTLRQLHICHGYPSIVSVGIGQWLWDTEKQQTHSFVPLVVEACDTYVESNAKGKGASKDSTDVDT